jgi:hypothetical protein
MISGSSLRCSLIAVILLAFAPAIHAQTSAQTSPLTPDIPAKYEAQPRPTTTLSATSWFRCAMA